MSKLPSAVYDRRYSSQHLSGSPRAPEAERIPLGIGQQEHDGYQQETKEQAHDQQQNTAYANVNQAGNNGQSYPGYGHDHAAEEMGDELFETVHVGRVDPHADMVAVGATLPVLPYLLMSGSQAFFASALVCGLALFIVGALISVFTGRSLLFSGVRMVFIGALAATFTYFIGKLLGVEVGG